MDNPYHLFLKTANPNISPALHSLNASDANWFRTRYQLSGSIFQGRFTSFLVDADSYALVLSTYLHLHPLPAGIVDALVDYPWSSYLDDLNVRKPLLDNLAVVFVLKFFSGDKSTVSQQYQQYLREHQFMEGPLTESYHGFAAGSDDFLQEMKLNLEHQKLSREIPFIHLKPADRSDEILANLARITQLSPHEIIKKEGISIVLWLYI